MRKNKRTFNFSKKEINRSIVTLGFSGVIGLFAFVYLLWLVAVFIVIIIVVVLFINWLIKYNIHKKINPIIDKLDTCDTSEFIDIASDIINSSFNKGYVLHSDFISGIKKIEFSFIQTDEIITYDRIISIVSDIHSNHKGIVTNSYLDKNALSYCKRNLIVVADRDALIDMMIFNYKHK